MAPHPLSLSYSDTSVLRARRPYRWEPALCRQRPRQTSPSPSGERLRRVTGRRHRPWLRSAAPHFTCFLTRWNEPDGEVEASKWRFPENEARALQLAAIFENSSLRRGCGDGGMSEKLSILYDWSIGVRVCVDGWGGGSGCLECATAVRRPPCRWRARPSFTAASEPLQWENLRVYCTTSTRLLFQPCWFTL